MAIPSLSSLSSLGNLDLLRGSSRKQGSSGDLSSLLDVPTTNKKSEKLTGADSSDQLSSLLSGLDLGFLQGQSNAVQALSLNLESSRSEFSLTGQGFAARGFQENLSLDATLKLGDQLVSLNVQITRSAVGIAAAGPAAAGLFGQGDDSNGFSLESLLDRLPDDAKELVKKFTSGGLPTDYFSPENTANRIADFALGGYKLFEGGAASRQDSSESRQRFADYILPAIDKGFADARKILGALPQQISDDIDQTRSLIGKRFDDFLNGMNATA
jgi:hypothetical protein